jgi:hypothetical protein
MRHAVLIAFVCAVALSLEPPQAGAQSQQAYNYCAQFAQQQTGYNGPQQPKSNALRGAAGGAAGGALIGGMGGGNAGRGAAIGAASGALIGGSRKQKQEQQQAQAAQNFQQSFDHCMSQQPH